MALYQPTNVIPSSYTKGTVDAVNDKMEISWQVNGNSAMTAFQIDFYLNDANSTYVTSTGKLTDNIPFVTENGEKRITGFYGTDRFGRPQFFTWSANDTWNNFNSGFTNGNEYKYKITQFFKGENNVIKCQANIALSVGNTYYFKVPNSNAIVYFSVSSNLVAETKNIYYSTTNNYIWVDNGSRIVLCGGNYMENGAIPNGAIGVTGEVGATTLDELFVSQTSSNIVVTMNKPTLTIYRSSTNNYSDKIDFPSNGSIATSIGFFKAVYTQLQSDPIRWIRWQVATVTYNADTKKWIVGEILADTGDIYTPTLNFEFNGFFNGQQYAIRAIGESESGQSCDSGWILFTINIENQGDYAGDFTVQCLNKENATLLEWEGVEVIPPTTSPQGYEPQITNGSVTLNGKNGDTEYSVTWDKVMNENGDLQNMNFPKPWTAVWKAQLSTTIRQETISLNFAGNAETPSDYDPTVISGININGLPTQISRDINNVRVLPDSTPIRQSDGTYKSEFTISPILPYAQASTGAFTLIGATYISGITRTNSDGGVTNIVISNGIPTSAILTIHYVGYEYTKTLTYPKDILSYQITNTSNTIDRSAVINGTDIIFRLYGKNSTDNLSIVATVIHATYYFASFERSLEEIPNIIEIIKYEEKNLRADFSQISYTATTITVNLFRLTKGQSVSDTVDVTYTYRSFLPQGKLFGILDNNIIINLEEQLISLYLNGGEIGNLQIPFSANAIAIIFAPNNVYAIYYENTTPNVNIFAVDDYQQQITSVTIYGGDSGLTVDSVSVYNNKVSQVDISSLYQDYNFEPVWNSPDYDLYMTANFNGNLEGGTGTATGKGFRVYRQEVGKNVLTPIATVPSTTTSIKDYGIVSRKTYKYSLYAYDNNGAFMSAVENEKVVATCFKNYSLLVCDYDEANDEYHVRKQYLFALNLSVGSVANNNSPTLNANFTRYPTRMPSTQNYASGTLSGLIGAIYTVPALIEQIGNYNWTAKPSTLDYFDSVDLEQELYDLSTAPYQLFLRDMKGRLRMVATNGAITMTTNIKQKQQSISISFPWVEIGDASDVTIIQTPEDYGWNNDNQVLDVLLDVDVATGELSATYPFPYNGTKFYLTGVNKETLTAKTPLGVTPAQFDLSETATQPDDGELNATVKVNSEDNLDYDMDWGAYELADVDTEDEGN